jgi:hypothetical protein
VVSLLAVEVGLEVLDLGGVAAATASHDGRALVPTGGGGGGEPQGRMAPPCSPLLR